MNIEAVAREITGPLFLTTHEVSDIQARVVSVLRRHAAPVVVTGADVSQAVTAARMDLGLPGWNYKLADAINARLRARSADPYAVTATPQYDGTVEDFTRARAAEVAPVVVEVAEDEVRRALDPSTQRTHRERANIINASLRARAADTIACRIVKRPTVPVKGTSTLVVPENGQYVRRGLGIPVHTVVFLMQGEELSDRITAIRRIDTDEPTTWIERTQTPDTVTTRAWEAGDCLEMVGHRLLMLDDAENYADFIYADATVEQIVKYANTHEAATILVLPEGLT
jgi:hypothetical protein